VEAARGLEPGLENGGGTRAEEGRGRGKAQEGQCNERTRRAGAGGRGEV